MKALKIGNLCAAVPVVQGGMGVGISLSGLASAVAREGGIGVISSAGLGVIYKDYSSDYRKASIWGAPRRAAQGPRGDARHHWRERHGRHVELRGHGPHGHRRKRPTSSSRGRGSRSTCPRSLPKEQRPNSLRSSRRPVRPNCCAANGSRSTATSPTRSSSRAPRRADTSATNPSSSPTSTSRSRPSSRRWSPRCAPSRPSMSATSR